MEVDKELEQLQPPTSEMEVVEVALLVLPPPKPPQLAVVEVDKEVDKEVETEVGMETDRVEEKVAEVPLSPSMLPLPRPRLPTRPRL